MNRERLDKARRAIRRRAEVDADQLTAALAALRRRHQITRGQVAELLGISMGEVARIEENRGRPVTIEEHARTRYAIQLLVRGNIG